MLLLAQAAQGTSSPALTSEAELVAWVCFVIGIILLIAGTAIGLYITFVIDPRDKKKAEELKQEAKEGVAALAAMSGMMTAAEVAQTEAKADATKAKIDQLASIIASLPERLRFPGLLILVGAVLMSVATVQFGGTSLF